MYDLETFRERVTQLYRAADPFEDGHRPTQGDLADAVGLARAELNRRLHGKAGYRLTADNARAIIRTLAKWGAIQTQAAAIELLSLVECRPFSEAEWQTPPLNQLAPSQHHSALSTQHSAPGNLPQALTSFVGRETEIAQCRQLLTETRLLTITGAGGVGKTRLAIEVAAGLRGSYTDGIWLVKLAALTDPNLVPQLVAATLGVREEATRPIIVTLLDYLRQREMLLILDNCEHLVGACALLAKTLLSACPSLCTIATSREGLGVAGETDWRLPSLSLPDPHHLPALPDLNQYEAVQLFTQRATSTAPSFKLNDKNAVAVAEVCQRLDGIPLAIELAAPLVKALSVPKIAQRLDDRFSLLTRGDRTAMPRQQTLRASIEWSYDLLGEAERILLCRLAVFAGGWQLEAAEAVCSDERLSAEEVLSGHVQLVGKSLLVAEEQDGESRYRMLETIRQFADERLAASGEEEALMQRHAQLYLALAEQSKSQLLGSEQAHWLERLELEHDNLRVALSWAIAHGDAELALRLAAAATGFWYGRGYLSEALTWLQQALASGQQATMASRAAAMYSVGRIAFAQSDTETAGSFYEQSLKLYRILKDERRAAYALNGLGMVADRRADCSRAQQFYEESLALKRQLGDREHMATTLSNLAGIEAEKGNYTRAEALLAESLELAQELGNQRGVAATLYDSGEVAYWRGDYTKALACYQQSLVLNLTLGNKFGVALSAQGIGMLMYRQADYASAHSSFKQALVIAEEIGLMEALAAALAGCGYLALAVEQDERAARLLAAAQSLRDARSIIADHRDIVEQERHEAILRARLGEVAFNAAWAQGQAMPLDRAIAYAQEDIANRFANSQALIHNS